MPSPDQLKNFTRLQNGVAFDSSLKLVAELPPYPAALKARFPEMAQHEAALKEWHANLILALQGVGQPTIETKKP